MALIKSLLPENEFSDTMFPDDLDSDFNLELQVSREAEQLKSSELPNFITQMY